MARGNLPRPSKDKENHKDTENQRGIIRNLRKQVEHLKREVSRLTKHIDSRQEMREDYMDGLEIPETEDEFSGWRCQKCKHNEYDEFVIPQAGIKLIRHLTCKKCGHKERQVDELNGNRC